MSGPVEQRYVTLAEAANYLGMSPKTLYGWAEHGMMPGYKVGRVWRFDRTELDQFVREWRTLALYNSSACSGPGRKGV